MNEAELFALAARGNADAQAALIDIALSLPADGVCTRDEAVCAAELMARMVATHGRPVDRMRLAAVLLIRAETALNMGDGGRHRVFQDEAVAVLNRLAGQGNRAATISLILVLNGMAEEGNEEAAKMLNAISDEAPVELMREATGTDRFWRGEMAGTA